MYELAVQLVTDIFASAVPVAIVFEVANLMVSTFMRCAFGGKLWFGS